MKLILVVMCVLLLALPVFAQEQISVNYQWDASPSPASPDNPIKYRLNICTDEALTACTPYEAGTALTLSVPMASGRYWAYVTAYCYAVSADNPDGPFTGGPLEESDKSNIVPSRVNVPPGNPANAKIHLQ